jgi:hypothetical protein
MFCASGLIFGGTEGIVSRINVLGARTHFRRYRGRRVPFSCFKRPDSFSAVTRASVPVFMFCASGLIFGGTEGIVSRINVLGARTHFRRLRGRRVPFSCFALPDSFSAVARATRPVLFFARPDSFSTVLRATRHVFIFCAPGLVFGRTSTSGPIFMFCAPGLFFEGNEAVRSHFHVLRARSRFRR